MQALAICVLLNFLTVEAVNKRPFKKTVSGDAVSHHASVSTYSYPADYNLDQAVPHFKMNLQNDQPFIETDLEKPATHRDLTKHANFDQRSGMDKELDSYQSSSEQPSFNLSTPSQKSDFSQVLTEQYIQKMTPSDKEIEKNPQVSHTKNQENKSKIDKISKDEILSGNASIYLENATTEVEKTPPKTTVKNKVLPNKGKTKSKPPKQKKKSKSKKKSPKKKINPHHPYKNATSPDDATNVRGPSLFDNEVLQNIAKAEDKDVLMLEFSHIFDSEFKSFLFNPMAEDTDKFQACSTPRNETGKCQYVQHCMMPDVLSSLQHFLTNVCLIEQRFIGVCCPDFPVSRVEVQWDDLNATNETLHIPRDCGVGPTHTRIVGGSAADKKAWPWMVALLNNKNKFYCGGSLINDRYVLTAAHCTFGQPKNQIVARLGEYDFQDSSEPHADYRVVSIKRHGQYTQLTLRNDIALLQLERPVAFNEFIKTICLPEPGNTYVDQIGTLAGWGHLEGGGTSSDVLQEGNFPIISNEQCQEKHSVPVPSSLICAATPKEDSGACNGDSGGPLMMLDSNDRWKIIGLVSWGRRGCNPKFPTVYSRITFYLDWIKMHSH